MVIKAAITEPLRQWQVFFAEAERPGLWRFFARRGFRHVAAAAYYADQDRWVFVQPTRRRMVVTVARPDEAGPIYQQLVMTATAILRVNGREQRRSMLMVLSCVGAIRALLGIRGRALSPYGLYRHLRAQGAEVVEVPQRPAP